MLRAGAAGSPQAVGVFTVDWQWAPCGWTHADCGVMFENVRWLHIVGATFRISYASVG
jgi:hypothetical protein